jgi:imidazole glycerol-phosphate synthase subunit HisH
VIGIIDYGMGNVESVYQALSYLDAEPVITSDRDVLARCERLILPGVGAFGDAMRNLDERGLIPVLNGQVREQRKPFLGICLGMQLLARSSTEHGVHEGLGWLDADVVRFDLDGRDLKVPHMGWNDVTLRRHGTLFDGLSAEQTIFYFVHSYHMVCRRASDVVAECDYGYRFAAAVCHENIFATQFHPEKSQDSGLHVLQKFLEWEP